jgi:hypothetical protein
MQLDEDGLKVVSSIETQLARVVLPEDFVRKNWKRSQVICWVGLACGR